MSAVRTLLVNLNHIAYRCADFVKIYAALQNRLQALLFYVAERNFVRFHPARHLHTGIDLAVCRNGYHAPVALTERTGFSVSVQTAAQGRQRVRFTSGVKIQ